MSDITNDMAFVRLELGGIIDIGKPPPLYGENITADGRARNKIIAELDRVQERINRSPKTVTIVRGNNHVFDKERMLEPIETISQNGHSPNGFYKTTKDTSITSSHREHAILDIAQSLLTEGQKQSPALKLAAFDIAVQLPPGDIDRQIQMRRELKEKEEAEKAKAMPPRPTWKERGIALTRFLTRKEIPISIFNERALSEKAEKARQQANGTISESDREDHIAEMKRAFGVYPTGEPLMSAYIAPHDSYTPTEVDPQIKRSAHDRIVNMGLASRWNPPAEKITTS